MKNEFISTALSRLGKGVFLALAMFMALLFTGCGPDPSYNHEEKKEDPPKPMTAEELVEKCGPSVVNIYSNKTLGSGVIYQVKDGYAYIVTNDHVLRNGGSFLVRLSDARTFKAEKIGTDIRTDIAVLKIEATNLQEAKFTDSSAVKNGQKAFAIGNAEGNENSITDGIIRKSEVTSVDFNGRNINKYLQTSASINAGNSGGALFNELGEVIGINDMSLNNADDINFAIPSNKAKEMADKLIKDGYVSWPYIGITDELVKFKNGTIAIKIINVRDKSPAAEAGLKKGDYILKIDSTPVENVAKLREKINSSGKGTVMTLHVMRVNKNNKYQEGEIEVTIGELPKSKDQTIDWS